MLHNTVTPEILIKDHNPLTPQAFSYKSSQPDNDLMLDSSVQMCCWFGWRTPKWIFFLPGTERRVQYSVGEQALNTLEKAEGMLGVGSLFSR